MRSRVFASLLLVSCAAFAAETPEVLVRRLPDGGIKPSAAVDSAGVLHVVYFRGEPAGGDAFYVHSSDAGGTWSAPLRVNSQPGSVLGASSIRGPRLALGREGRIHVAWNGSSKASERTPLNPAMPADSPFNGTPLLYSRIDQARTAFEPQRNVMKITTALDGGSDIAADNTGRVYVVFHAMLPGGKSETDRAVFIAESKDDGATFADERNVLPEPTGACPCCALAATADASGKLAIIYRAAVEGSHRGMHELLSTDRGATFRHTVLDDWKLSSCPMSAASIVLPGRGEPIMAWENAGHIVAKGQEPTPMGDGQKLPAIATHPKTGTLLAWTEGVGFGRGGAVHWRLTSPSGRVSVDSNAGQAEDLPAHGTVAAVALPDGRFVLMY